MSYAAEECACPGKAVQHTCDKNPMSTLRESLLSCLSHSGVKSTAEGDHCRCPVLPTAPQGVQWKAFSQQAYGLVGEQKSAQRGQAARCRPGMVEEEEREGGWMGRHVTGALSAAVIPATCLSVCPCCLSLSRHVWRPQHNKCMVCRQKASKKISKCYVSCLQRGSRLRHFCLSCPPVLCPLSCVYMSCVGSRKELGGCCLRVVQLHARHTHGTVHQNGRSSRMYAQRRRKKEKENGREGQGREIREVGRGSTEIPKKVCEKAMCTGTRKGSTEGTCNGRAQACPLLSTAQRMDAAGVGMKRKMPGRKLGCGV